MGQLSLFGEEDGNSGRHRDISLKKAREFVRIGREGDGVFCPCCEQWCKIHKRKLSSNMGRFLLDLVIRWLETRDWVHFKKCRIGGYDYSVLAHFGLIERKPNDDSAKKTSGFWRPTEKGIAFLRGKLRVPSHVYLYNDRCFGFTSELVFIEDVFRSKFDYQELIRGRFDDERQP